MLTSVRVPGPQNVARAFMMLASLALLGACETQASVADAELGNDATRSDLAGDTLRHADAGADSSVQGKPPQVWASAKFAVTETKAVVYAKGIVGSAWGASAGKEVNLLLDLFTPDGLGDGLRPAVVFIHGGGFKGGSRTQAALVAQARFLAQRGWVTASIDYRLAGTEGTIPTTWAQTIQRLAPQNVSVGNAMYLAGRDAKAAVRWLHANAARYSVDPGHIAVAGGSAGAITAVGIAASEPEDFRDELTNAQDPTRATAHLAASSKIAAIIDYWGGPVLVTALEAVAGSRRFGPDDPPLLIIHGTADPTVKFTAAQELERLWKASGIPYEFYPLQGAGHGVWNATHNGKTLVELAFDFLVAKQGLRVR